MGTVKSAQRRQFLEVLTETSSVAAAAAAAGIAIDMAFRIRDADAGFAAGWARALEIGYELIEGHLLAAARGAETGIDTALARQMLAQRGRGRPVPAAAAGGAKAAGEPASTGAQTGVSAGTQVKKVSIAEVEAEVLRLLAADGGKA